MACLALIVVVLFLDCSVTTRGQRIGPDTTCLAQHCTQEASREMATTTAYTADKLRIVTWNCLAHIHTHWNGAAHQNYANHNDDVGLESEVQMNQRHRQVVSVLNRLSPDVALLQEVDKHLLPLDWEPGQVLPCGTKLDGYSIYRSFSHRHEGTAILLKDSSMVLDPNTPPVYLRSTAQHGWKTGIVVHARRATASTSAEEPLYAFATVHLRHHNTTAKLGLLTSATAEMRKEAHKVLTGDFNTATADLKPIEAPLHSVGLLRVPTRGGVTTALGGCQPSPPAFRRTGPYEIDHVYASQCLQPIAPPEIGELPLPPKHTRGPWGDFGGDGSDHSWVAVDFRL